jgi:hypothetical protein
LMQQMEVPLDPKDKRSPEFTFRGGTTIVLTQDGDVHYAIQKQLGKDDDGNTRLKRQREYYEQADASAGLATYLDAPSHDGRPMNFNLIHRGY